MQERCREGRSRTACIAAYGAGAYAAAADDGGRLAALRTLAGLWLTQRGRDLEAALRAWALVASAADARSLPAPLVEAFVEALEGLLAVRGPCTPMPFTLQTLQERPPDMGHPVQGNDVAVRNAAVTATGVLYRRCGLRIVSDLPPGGPVAPPSPPPAERPGSPDALSEASCDSFAALEAAAAVRLDAGGCEVGPEARDALSRGLEGILRRVRELATNRCARGGPCVAPRGAVHTDLSARVCACACRGDAQRRSKSDRRSSRAAAVAVLAALADEGGGERIKVPRCGVVTLTALPQVVAYREVAAALGSGVQAHLARNPLLGEMFGIDQGQVRFCGACLGHVACDFLLKRCAPPRLCSVSGVA